MSQPLRFVGFVALLLFAPFVSTANVLKWDTVQKEISCFVGQKILTAEFRFENDRLTPVVMHLATNCSCVDALSDKASYNAGESGTIYVNYSVPDKPTILKQSIMVYFYGASFQPDELTLTVHVLDAISVNPDVMVWSTGAKGSLRAVVLHTNYHVKITSVKGVSTGAVDCNRDWNTPSDQYRFLICPSDTTRKAVLKQIFLVTLESGLELTLSATVIVH